MIEFEIDQRLREQTVMRFKVFGHEIYSEWYPKYGDGTFSLESAARDSKRRFARHWQKALELAAEKT